MTELDVCRLQTCRWHATGPHHPHGADDLTQPVYTNFAARAAVPDARLREALVRGIESQRQRDAQSDPDDYWTGWNDALDRSLSVVDVAARAAVPDAGLREALEAIESKGCEASIYHGEEPPVWERCRDYEYREDMPTGDPNEDRCHPCIAHAALAAFPAPAPRLDVVAWRCDWEPDDLNPGPDCPYCAGDMCARIDGLNCTHNREERHGYAALPAPEPRPDTLDVERLARALLSLVSGNSGIKPDQMDEPWDFGWLGDMDLTPREAAAAIVDEYALTPQPTDTP